MGLLSCTETIDSLFTCSNELSGTFVKCSYRLLLVVSGMIFTLTTSGKGVVSMRKIASDPVKPIVDKASGAKYLACYLPHRKNACVSVVGTTQQQKLQLNSGNSLLPGGVAETDLFTCFVQCDQKGIS
ncbi:hypothetical protein ZHAS_00011188 [Anopheles sinensis]|uniref:Uncharacterized protein n=1 Tax=Anopheles sinensis TaxID=74873 RepID=A0A084VZJ8_ANOSI|nr:hypothetical protein ZHAS_00011188 [Anopheles sinensis]